MGGHKFNSSGKVRARSRSLCWVSRRSKAVSVWSIDQPLDHNTKELLVPEAQDGARGCRVLWMDKA